jgi:aldose 1-epimerase
MADRVRLRGGDLELELCPRTGGVVTAFRGRGHDLMRPAPAGALANPGEASSFPLVPFSNRIADARFAFGGRSYAMPANFPPEPHAIHGQGWQLPWRVEARSAARVILSLSHAVADTPFDYSARQSFTLGDDGLVVTIAVTNTGATPMPAGIGLHPYFPRTEGVTLQADLDHVWLPDEAKIPKERVALPQAGTSPRDRVWPPSTSITASAAGAARRRFTGPRLTSPYG